MAASVPRRDRRGRIGRRAGDGRRPGVHRRRRRQLRRVRCDERQAAVALAHRQHLQRAPNIPRRRTPARADAVGDRSTRSPSTVPPVARIGMGLVGAGFVGPHHIDAVRRLGLRRRRRDRRSSEASARAKAEALGVPKAYGSYEALLDDPDVHVVHNATPNYLHYPVNARRHRARQARRLRQAAGDDVRRGAGAARAGAPAGVVHAVTFNYRGNPLVQQARTRSRAATSARRISSTAAICRTGCSRTPTIPGGSSPTRAARRRRSATSDRTGATWRSTSAACASRRCSATSTTVVAEAEEAARSARGVCGGPATRHARLVDIRVEDLASVLVRFDNGAKGSFSVGQVCAGHKNDLALEVCGATASLAVAPGTAERAVDRAPRRGRTRCCRRTRRCSTPHVRRYAHLPGGHQEGWADAFCNVMRDIYGFIAAARGRPIATCRRRLRRSRTATAPNCIVDAILDEREGRRRVDSDTERCQTPFEPKFMKVGILTAALQELTPREVRDADPDRAIEDWVAFARELGADHIQLSAALHPTESGRAAGGDARSGGEHARSAAAVRQDAGAARAGGAHGDRRRPVGHRLLRQHAAPRRGGPAEEARVHAARVRRRGAARRQRRLRLRRPQPAAQHGPEPRSTSRSSSCRCCKRPRRAG